MQDASKPLENHSKNVFNILSRYPFDFNLLAAEVSEAIDISMSQLNVIDDQLPLDEVMKRQRGLNQMTLLYLAINEYRASERPQSNDRLFELLSSYPFEYRILTEELIDAVIVKNEFLRLVRTGVDVIGEANAQSSVVQLQMLMNAVQAKWMKGAS